MPLSVDQTLVSRLRERIYAECDASAILAGGGISAAATVRSLVQGFLIEERVVLSESQVIEVIDQVVAATTGYGPIERLLGDPSITEVMVNGPHHVFVERNGKLESTSIRFADDEHVRQVLDRILAPIGRRIDAATPTVDARLPNGSRVHAIASPVSLEGTTITIRRFLEHARTLDDLKAIGACSDAQLAVIRDLLAERTNVIVAGATSSGKTTLLSAALAECDKGDRLVIIEDASEIAIEHPHRIRLESRPASLDGVGEISVRELVRNALRMRPDRIVVGEVRGAEAFDLVQALNTGHRGCWSTVHANSAEDALHRIESMSLMADVGVPHAIVRRQIGRAIGAVVFVARSDDGSRSIQQIAEVGERGEGWCIARQLCTG